MQGIHRLHAAFGGKHGYGGCNSKSFDITVQVGPEVHQVTVMHERVASS